MGISRNKITSGSGAVTNPVRIGPLNFNTNPLGGRKNLTIFANTDEIVNDFIMSGCLKTLIQI
jgi:hypothetical protein